MGELAAIITEKVSEDYLARLRLAAGRSPSNWELIPVAGLKHSISVLGASATKCDLGQAKKAAEVLLGSYPYHSIGDPQIYSRGIVSVLQGYPPKIAAAAIDQITRTSKFVPTRAEVDQTCKSLFDELRATIVRAKRMLEEHEIRAEAEAEEAKRKAEREEFLEKHGGKSPLEVLREEGIELGEPIEKETP